MHLMTNEEWLNMARDIITSADPGAWLTAEEKHLWNIKVSQWISEGRAQCSEMMIRRDG